MAIVPDALLAAYHLLYETVREQTAYLGGGPDGWNLISYTETAAIDAAVCTVANQLALEEPEPL